MNAICLDIEATDNGEILEISIFNHTGKEIFHSYFKPVKAKSWPISEEIHHISPEMVARCKSVHKAHAVIQRIIDSADAIIGFAVDNDLNYLSRSGFNVKKPRIIEMKRWYWLLKGKGDNVDINSVPRLVQCAENMNVDFNPEDAHSATNDTKFTLQLFNILYGMFCDSREIPNDYISTDTLNLFDDCYRQEEELIKEENARGFISLKKGDRGYSIKNNRKKADSDLCIEVTSRFIAEHDLRIMFKKRELHDRPGIFNLRQSDIDAFIQYSNSYDAEKEALYRSIYNRKGAKNLSNSPFRLI